jgi:hypothetical protein
MGMITSIRAPLPAAELPSVTTDPGGRETASTGAARPVAATVQVQAVQQAPAKTVSGDARLLAMRTTAETSAAAAAEAARNAYIKASIAAGISPLPLP